MSAQANDPGNDDLVEYLLRLGDTALINGQRLSEWCGHAAFLEQDISFANTALDFIGRARVLLGRAAALSGGDATEDTLAFLREERHYRNLLLVEQPNRDFGDTVIRQYLLDEFECLHFEALTASADSELAAIAAKTLKECHYHRRQSAGWVVRLGDGTEESHQRAQQALDINWCYTDEMFASDELEQRLADAGVGTDVAALRAPWHAAVEATLDTATLAVPDDDNQVDGGRYGRHTEHMGFLLAEMQHMQRMYPGQEW